MTHRLPRSRPGYASGRKWRRSCQSGRTDAQIDGVPVEILGLPDHVTYRDRWPLLQSTANAWDRLRTGNAGLVSEQLARRLKLVVGDRIENPGARWELDA